jgi:protein O-mannosyl-transferase
VILCYANSFQGRFFLDDDEAILNNASIKDWSALSAVLHPTQGTTTGRPILNLTFAANWAWTGQALWGFHLFNVLIHVAGALTLFGLVRRTLLLPLRRHFYGKDAIPLAAFVALLWALHPLQTSAVTYISQRAESLMGFFYLLTLYLFVRAANSRNPTGWYWGSAAACYCGMAAKEVMVTAPVIVLFYDSVLITGSLRSAWRARKAYYLVLASSWILLAGLMIDSRIGSYGIGSGVSWWTYALTESRVVVKYLGLFLWPHPLVFDYGAEIFSTRLREVWPYLITLLCLLGASALLWKRSKAFGLLALACFVLLAPTSSIVPIALQPMAESRMYLPVAPLAALTVLGAYAAFGRKTMAGFALVGIAFAVLTLDRNRVYRNELVLWQDTIAKQPNNSRALTHLGLALSRAGKPADAIVHYEAALRLKPDQPEALTNLGFELSKIPGRSHEVIAYYRRALQSSPDFVPAHLGLAQELSKIPGTGLDAISHVERALELNPNSAPAHNAMGLLLGNFPARADEAIVHYQAAVRLDPFNFEPHFNLANELAKNPTHQTDALAHYEETLRLNPDFPAAHNAYGMCLARIPGRVADAMSHYREAFRIDPDCFEAHNNLANELTKIAGRQSEAVEHYKQAILIRPDIADLHFNLAVTYYKLSRLKEAIEHFEAVLRLDPSRSSARTNLEKLRAVRPAGPSAP